MPSTKSATSPEPAGTTPEDGQRTKRSRGPSLNRVTLVGRLAADPQLRYSSSGTAVAMIRLVTNDRDEPEFHDVVAWRELAEVAAKYLAKGRLVLVEGRLHGRSWLAEDGTTRRGVEVVAASIQFLTPPPGQEPAES